MLSSTSLLHNNCIFNRNNTVATQQGLKTYWLCKSYRVSMCRARCITHHGQVISSTGVHNHPPHMKGPHEFSHQPQPQPPPPPPNLGPPQPIPQNHHPQDHPQNIPPALNNGTYQDIHHNSHYQPHPSVMMGPPPTSDPNQYPSHHHHHSHPQQPPYPELPPHHHHPYPTHYANPPPNMPPQPPMVNQPPPPPPHLPPQNTAALPEPEAPDIKLIELEPAVLSISAPSTPVDSSTISLPAGVANAADNIAMQAPQAVAAATDPPDEANPQHLQLKIEQLS